MCAHIQSLKAGLAHAAQDISSWRHNVENHKCIHRVESPQAESVYYTVHCKRPKRTQLTELKTSARWRNVMTKPEAIQNNNTLQPQDGQTSQTIFKWAARLLKYSTGFGEYPRAGRWSRSPAAGPTNMNAKKRQQKQVPLTLLNHWDTVLLCCRKHTNRMRWFDQFICILHILEQYVAWKINAYITYNTTQNQSQAIYTENIKKKIRLNLWD